ncbi:hypothetical protein [Flagellimonas sp. CMM7]|uniref:hypothetical protein n=1 Tax=Flagellimonas sp. CMM7 TaxID=2654676 RepID=UPI0013D71BEC|nr:hypothetical protein [Flagellimonas sp. CMM7]UII79988.1 hypothetical protein LV704_00355 [Flagellimonas sp. CMM7]
MFIKVHIKGFFWVSCLLLLTSCGSKKKVSSSEKKSEEIKKDIVIKRQNDITTVAKFTKVANKMTIEPNDPNNPLIVNGDTLQNVKKVTYEKLEIDSTSTTNDKSIIKIDDKSESKKESKKKESNKEVEGVSGSDFKWSVWGIVVIMILGFVIYLFRGKLFKNN